MKKGWVVIIALGIVAAVGFQFRSIANLKAEVVALRAELQGVEVQAPATVSGPRPVAQVSLGTLPQRVSQLEDTVADLAKASDVLVERGMVPPSAQRIEEMQARFFDPNASDRDRLRAFQLMRRNGGINDQVAMQAVNWLQASTNAGTRRNLLRQMDGLTNATLREPLIAMMSSEQNGNVREELVDVLADFVSDPAVEQKMWDMALNDPDGDVREEAGDALTDGEITPARIESFRQRAGDANLSLDARLLALRGLNEANASAPEIIADMAHLAQTSTDPVTRVKLFEAFDGIQDPSLMAPLVFGLQDPNPVVRERAADALGSFGSDERVQQWLNHVIQNDTDPRVKREAFQALEQGQRRRDRGN
jgi:hypothetical protein